MPMRKRGSDKSINLSFRTLAGTPLTSVRDPAHARRSIKPFCASLGKGCETRLLATCVFDPKATIHMSKPGALRGLRRPLKVEITLNLLFIVVLPLVLRGLDRLSGGVGLALAKSLGLDNDYQRLAGTGGVGDIVQVPAAARALLETDYRAYDPMEFLVPLVGLKWPAFVPDPLMRSYTHPPFEFPLGLPLAYMDYLTWLPFWMTSMMVALALSLRLVGLPPSLAYPFALIFIASYPGRESLVTSYPLAGLLLALAWFMRDRQGTAGAAYALLGGLRGYGLIMLAYPLWRRQWRAIAIAASVLIALLAVAVVLEPTVIWDFLDRGMGSASLWVLFIDNNAPFRFLQPLGIPYWALVVAVVVIAGLAWKRGHPLFWILAWSSFMVTPLAWVTTLGSALPLAGWLARSSAQGRVLILLALPAVVATPIGWGVSWSLFLVLSGVAIFLSPRRPISRRQVPEASTVR